MRSISLPFRVKVKDRLKTECRKQTSRTKTFFYRLMLKLTDPKQNTHTVVFRLEFGVHCSAEHHTLFESLETVYGEDPCHYNEEKSILL